MWTSIKNFFAKLIGWFRRKRAAVGFAWSVEGIKEGDMALTLTNTQKVTLLVQPVDAKGFGASVDGLPTWVQSDASVGTLTANGFAAEFVALAPGQTQITVSADADLGAGTRVITGVLDILVEVGEAATLIITAGTPVQQ